MALIAWGLDIEPETLLQAERAGRLPVVSGHVALMPDAHVGIGATVGSVIPTEGAMKRDAQRDAPIKWKVWGAGFIIEGSFVALIDRDTDPFPCVFNDEPDHAKACMETWATVWVLEGNTLDEAKLALEESRFRGAAYHLSDCQLLDDRPAEENV